MRLAFTRWGLAPAAFWAMSPRELAACLAPLAPSDRPDGAALQRLMWRFPDHPGDDDGE